VTGDCIARHTRSALVGSVVSRWMVRMGDSWKC
jgi:hypothetical protein